MKNLIFLLAFIAFLLLGCAPRVAPPPLYRGVDLTRDEIIARVGEGIETLKAVVNVTIAKNGVYNSSADASVIIRRPGLLHMRIYKFGMLLDDILISHGRVHVISGRERTWMREIGGELYQTIFWWDGMRHASLEKRRRIYIMKKEDSEIQVDQDSLFPIRQIIYAADQRADITYGNPMREGERWFPSFIRIELGSLRLSIKVEKLFVNPEAGERDFRLPGAIGDLRRSSLPSSARG